MTNEDEILDSHYKQIERIASGFARRINFLVPVDDLCQYGALSVLQWIRAGRTQCAVLTVAKRGMIDGMRCELRRGRFSLADFEVPYTEAIFVIPALDAVQSTEASIDISLLMRKLDPRWHRHAGASLRRAAGDVCTEIASDEHVNESMAHQLSTRGIRELRAAAGV